MNQSITSQLSDEAIHQILEIIASEIDDIDDKELQITGLIHDLGKVLFSFNEPSYCIVGDTYVVGCQFSDKIIYPETLQKNPGQLKMKKWVFMNKWDLCMKNTIKSNYVYENLIKRGSP